MDPDPIAWLSMVREALENDQPPRLPDELDASADASELFPDLVDALIEQRPASHASDGGHSARLADRQSREQSERLGPRWPA